MARADESIEIEPAEGDANPLRRLIPELKPYRGLITLSAVLTIAQSAFGFLPPLVLGDIVNRLQSGQNVNTWFYLLLIVGFAIGQSILAYALAISMSTLGQRF